MSSVVAPPKDQQHVDRLGLLYFSRYVNGSCSCSWFLLTLSSCRPHNDAVLKTAKESPVLQRAGYTQNSFEKSGNSVPTSEGQPQSRSHFISHPYCCYSRVDLRQAEVAAHQERSDERPSARHRRHPPGLPGATLRLIETQRGMKEGRRNFYVFVFVPAVSFVRVWDGNKSNPSAL